LNPKPSAASLHVLTTKLTTKGMKTMYKYRLNYLDGEGDGHEKTYESINPVKVGDVIQLDDYHQVIQVLKQKTGIRLDLSKSGQSAQETVLIREQSGRKLKF
jgi:hypothetical protein